MYKVIFEPENKELDDSYLEYFEDIILSFLNSTNKIYYDSLLIYREINTVKTIVEIEVNIDSQNISDIAPKKFNQFILTHINDSSFDNGLRLILGIDYTILSMKNITLCY